VIERTPYDGAGLLEDPFGGYGGDEGSVTWVWGSVTWVWGSGTGWRTWVLVL
jgi:hypothetical protein